MTTRAELAHLMRREDLITRQLTAIRARILWALVNAKPDDVESIRRISLRATSSLTGGHRRPGHHLDN